MSSMMPVVLKPVAVICHSIPLSDPSLIYSPSLKHSSSPLPDLLAY